MREEQLLGRTKEGRGNNNVGCMGNSNCDLLGSTCPTLSQEYISEMIIWDAHQRKTYVLFLLLYNLLLVIWNKCSWMWCVCVSLSLLLHIFFSLFCLRLFLHGFGVVCFQYLSNASQYTMAGSSSSSSCCCYLQKKMWQIFSLSLQIWFLFFSGCVFISHLNLEQILISFSTPTAFFNQLTVERYILGRCCCWGSQWGVNSGYIIMKKRFVVCSVFLQTLDLQTLQTTLQTTN